MVSTTNANPTDLIAAPNFQSNGTVTARPRRILVAEDNDQARQHLKTLLEEKGTIEVDTASDGKEALTMLTKGNHTYSVFLTDLKMPGLDGMKLIEEIRKRSLPLTVIVMTGFGSIEQAVQAMRLGARDFLTKPIDTDHLQLVINRALEERRLQDEVIYLREQLQERFSFHNIITKNARMLNIFELIQSVAHTTTTVLVEGPTGTGKEMVARAIHQASADFRSGPFVPVNCAALPENLLESELFGHEKGAFTGAISQRQGRFEMADRGTLFLDEVGEIPPSVQVKLLRVLQERQFERIGGSKPIEVDIRLIAATNRPLARLVKKKAFREDLYYRINVVRIDLPPLRERPDDILLLATHFTAKYAHPGEDAKQISPEARKILLDYDWPGNVRQLENVIERSCVICQSDQIEPHHLPAELTKPSKRSQMIRIDLKRPLPELIKETTADLEHQYIRKALEQTKGNVSKCAKICGMSRRSITAKIAEYGIDRGEAMNDE